VEAGLNRCAGGGSSFADVLSVSKGVIWLFLATIAEATPAVSPAGFVPPLLFSHHITLQVFISLDLNCTVFSPV
jgi:hypothetical protein